MKTKLVYVLVSSSKDFFWEQCFISIISAKSLMPSCKITLVCDNKTNITFKGTRGQLLEFINDKIVIDFDESIGNLERSRLLKVNLRKYVHGDYLYIDCDTLIVKDLSEIDSLEVEIGAVLEGHCLVKRHPMLNYFEKQNQHLGYDFSLTYKYFNAGVMFVRESDLANQLFLKWANNYNISVKKGSYIDQPPLSLSNQQLGNVISEINGVWNCQVRFGALYLAEAKILHFCSKKNMPIHLFSTKSYLNKVKKWGKDTPSLQYYIENWKAGFTSVVVSSFGEDANFNLSVDYEASRKKYVFMQLWNNIYRPHKTILERIISFRNKIIGRISPYYLSKILFKEKFGIDLESTGMSFNRMIHKLAFGSDISKWEDLADKVKVREYISQCGYAHILPMLYGVWKNVENLDISDLPNEFVLKCSHDNGSTLIIKDKHSLSLKKIRKYYQKRMNQKFGIETAEPHYKNIPSAIIAEELIQNDKQYSDSLVCFKFFSFYGETEYCQVIYDCSIHKNQRNIIYGIKDWDKKHGYIINKEGKIEIPKPSTLNEMVSIVRTLTKDLPFCRVDLYEYEQNVYFSELTFMPGAGRINSFSHEFMNILGKQLYLTKEKWEQH